MSEKCGNNNNKSNNNNSYYPLASRRTDEDKITYPKYSDLARENTYLRAKFDSFCTSIIIGILLELWDFFSLFIFNDVSNMKLAQYVETRLDHVQCQRCNTK